MEYKHQIEISQSSVPIKLYLKVWQAEAEHIDVCRLFWGYTFMPVAILFWVLSAPFLGIYKVLDYFVLQPYRVKQLQKTPPTVEEIVAARQARLDKPPSRAAKLLAKIADTGTRISFYLSSHPRIGQTFGVVFVTALGLTSIALLVMLAIEVGVLTFLGIVGGSFGAVSLVIGMFSGIAALGRRGVFGKLGTAVAKPFRLMYAGAMGVKSRTCPQLIVKD